MYGLKALQFDSSNPIPPCDICKNKHVHLFSLGDFSSIYDRKFCYFSDLAKEKVQLCQECIFDLRYTKQFQSKSAGAQNNLQFIVSVVVPYHVEPYQRPVAGQNQSDDSSQDNENTPVEPQNSPPSASTASCCSAERH